VKTSFTLKRQCNEIFGLGFFHESSDPKTMKKTFGSFHIYQNLRRYSQVNDTGGKFATGVRDTGGK